MAGLKSSRDLFFTASIQSVAVASSLAKRIQALSGIKTFKTSRLFKGNIQFSGEIFKILRIFLSEENVPIEPFQLVSVRLNKGTDLYGASF